MFDIWISECFFLNFLYSSICLEYVNQEIQDLRPGIPERPSTLPRKGSRIDRRLINDLSSGHSVENPGYLVPTSTGASTSPAFDNPYYLDLLAKAVAGAAVANGPEALERDGGVPRHVNGFVTPTAENPEYLGLADTWSGYTWGHSLGVIWWTPVESVIVFYGGKQAAREREDEYLCERNALGAVIDIGNSMCMWKWISRYQVKCPKSKKSPNHPAVTHAMAQQRRDYLTFVATFVFPSSSRQSVLSMWRLSAKKEVSLSASVYNSVLDKQKSSHLSKPIMVREGSDYHRIQQLTGSMNADFWFF